MMVPRAACPQCGSTWDKRNGHMHTGKQNHRCTARGRAFVLVPENRVITEEQRAVIARLLRERSARDLPRGGRRPPVALAVYGRAVPSGPGASLWPSRQAVPRR
jgi:hypothetical protein